MVPRPTERAFERAFLQSLLSAVLFFKILKKLSLDVMVSVPEGHSQAQGCLARAQSNTGIPGVGSTLNTAPDLLSGPDTKLVGQGLHPFLPSSLGLVLSPVRLYSLRL